MTAERDKAIEQATRFVAQNASTHALLAEKNTRAANIQRAAAERRRIEMECEAGAYTLLIQF